MNSRQCFVCDRKIRGDFGMCGVHWRMVPKALQQEIYSTFRSGDTNGNLQAWAKAKAVVRQALSGVSR